MSSFHEAALMDNSDRELYIGQPLLGIAKINFESRDSR